MFGRLGPRFALEAAFLILLAVGLGLADEDWVVILAVMGAGWLLVSLIEMIASRRPPWSYEARAAVPPPVAPPVEPESGPELPPEPVPEPAPPPEPVPEPVPAPVPQPVPEPAPEPPPESPPEPVGEETEEVEPDDSEVEEVPKARRRWLGLRRAKSVEEEERVEA